MFLEDFAMHIMSLQRKEHADRKMFPVAHHKPGPFRRYGGNYGMREYDLLVRDDEDPQFLHRQCEVLTFLALDDEQAVFNLKARGPVGNINQPLNL